MRKHLNNVHCKTAWYRKEWKTYVSINRTASAAVVTGARDYFAAAENNEVHLCTPTVWSSDRYTALGKREANC